MEKNNSTVWIKSKSIKPIQKYESLKYGLFFKKGKYYWGAHLKKDRMITTYYNLEKTYHNRLHVEKKIDEMLVEIMTANEFLELKKQLSEFLDECDELKTF